MERDGDGGEWATGVKRRGRPVAAMSELGLERIPRPRDRYWDVDGIQVL
jgi:hypothetical protein